MAKKAKRRRRKPEFKSARVSLSEADLGWHGTRGGRTVTVTFWDGRNSKVGELILSAARVRWKSARHKNAITVNSNRLDDLFDQW